MRLAWLAVGLLVMPVYAADVRLHEAETAIGRGDLITGMRLLRAAAMGGDAASQARLGQILDKADEDKEAVEWYRKAADQGHAAGQYGLGMEYYTGEGIAKDVAQALALWRQAAAQNHPSALQTLAGLGPDAYRIDPVPTPAAPVVMVAEPVPATITGAAPEPVAPVVATASGEPQPPGVLQPETATRIATPSVTPTAIPVEAPGATEPAAISAAVPVKPVKKTKSTPKKKERK